MILYVVTNIIPDRYTFWLDQLPCFILLFLAGETPKPSKDTQQNLPCGTDIRSMLWSATITNTEETNLRIKIQTGCDAIIGKWKFSVSSTYQFINCWVINIFSFIWVYSWSQIKTLHTIMPNRLKPRSALSRTQTYWNKNEKSTDMSMMSRYMLYLIHSANVSWSWQSCEIKLIKKTL